MDPGPEVEWNPVIVHEIDNYYAGGPADNGADQTEQLHDTEPNNTADNANSDNESTWDSKTQDIDDIDAFDNNFFQQ